MLAQQYRNDDLTTEIKRDYDAFAWFVMHGKETAGGGYANTEEGAQNDADIFKAAFAEGRMVRGAIVKYSRPEPGEEQFRFILKEDKGDRVDIQLVCDWTIKPIQTVARDEVTLAASVLQLPDMPVLPQPRSRSDGRSR